MKTKTNILTVSIAAIMAVSAANADIASTTYVNGKITPVENKIDTHAANNDIHVTAEQKTAWSAKQDAITATNKLPATNVSGLADVATTGAYSDLTGTPTIAEDYDGNMGAEEAKATIASMYAAETAAQSAAAGIDAKLQQSYQLKTLSDVATAGNYIVTGNNVATNLANLDTAAKNAKDAADAAQGTANEAKSAAATNATAIATETSAREAADTAINNKIGTVTNGKTVVEMINDAQSAATYDDTALAGRVKTIEDSAAYKSGITSALVTQINTNKTNIATNASDIDTLEINKQDKITDQNKLSAGLIATSATAQFVSDTEKSTWNAKQGAISDLETIRSNAAAGKGAADTIATYGDVVTHDASEFATSAQGGKADTALQSVTANDGAGVVTNVAKNGTAITMTKAKVTEADLADAVVAKLGAGNSALQASDIATGTANGTIAVDGTDVSVKGLKSAAYTESSAYATSAQGTKADSALQKADITTGTSTMANGTISVKGEAVAVKGLGSAAYTASTAYATSAQGGKADSALQKADITTGTANGTIAVDGTDVSVKGLGSAAYTASTAYAPAGNYITVPAASGTTGKSVLTYDADTTTYYWETIGR